MQARPSHTLLHRFFAGLAESTFQARLGVVDPPLIDYIADLLVRFVRCDAVYRLRDLRGRPIREVAEMLVEAEARVGDPRREAHRHVGDFTLFWTGVYPEAVTRMRSTMKKDHLLDYLAQGKRAYLLASTIETDDENDAPAELLERLSDRFEMCASGLREVRREWEHHSEDDMPRPFLIN